MPSTIPDRKTPPVNAQLQAISELTLVSDGGGGWTETEVVVWSGSASAYASEKISFEVFADGIHEQPQTIVSIPSNVPGTAAAVSPGTRLYYTREAGTAAPVLARRVTSVEERSDYGFIRTFTQEV